MPKVLVNEAKRGAGKRGNGGDRAASASALLLNSVPKVGVWVWTFVGLVLVLILVVTALSAVSEIVLPLTFAAVLAIIFKPLVGVLRRHKVKPTLAAGVVVLGLLAVMILVVFATVRGVTDQVAQIGASVDAALDSAGETLQVDPASLEAARAAAEELAPAITTGFLTHLVEGVGTLVGVASGLILGALIMYYLLKDGTRLRRAVVAQARPSIQAELGSFLGEAFRILRDYGRGRTVLSAIVALVTGLAALLLGLPLVFTIIVVNFIGGFIPYIGAFLGGGLAVLIAWGEGGPRAAAIMLVVVFASNLLLENFVEPKVMGRTLDIHPLVVLVVTALGGLLGGIVGLILAVPATVIAANAIVRLRSSGFVDEVADRAEPTVRRVLG
jgi:predicted PurR-regulated permease PerM